MAALYRFLGTHEVLVYILLSVGTLFGLRWLWRSWNEWRHAVYTLEKEFALRRIGQAIAILSLLLVLSCGELIMASVVVPSLPAAVFYVTATPDFLATPTGTISAELATVLALTPRPTLELTGASGCSPKKVEITAPKSGDEIRGTVDVRGTVNISEFGFYKYEVAPIGSDAWSTISAGRDKVVDGLLGRWDTATLSPGDYQLRLIATDNQGRALPACVIQVRVAPPS